jgi:hypothetical protein
MSQPKTASNMVQRVNTTTRPALQTPLEPTNQPTMMKYGSLLAACMLASAHAFSSMLGTSVSAFGGKVLVTGTSNGACLEMKKGKANVPPQMRSQYNRQKEMMAQRDAMIAASKPGPDGLPVFNLFVRSARANVSFPRV